MYWKKGEYEMKFLTNVSLIAWKEFIEIKRSIIKLSLVMLFPLVTIYFVGMNQGTSGVFSPEFNILSTQSFGGLFSLILLKDSIMREKNQKTLEVLLTSRISSEEIIVGKILPVLIVGLIAQVFQSLVMLGLLVHLESSMISVFTLQSFIFIIIVNYIMSTVCLSISTIINDEKASDIGAIGGAYIVGVVLLLGAISFNVFIDIKIFLIALVLMIVLSFVSTKICVKIFDKSMLYIKI